MIKFFARLAFFMTLLIAMGITAGGRASAGGGTVSNCNNDSEFSSKLAGGGDILFACGNATIVLSSAKIISANTTIDGGGKITLSGDSQYRHFIVNNGATLTLQNITLSSGYANGDGGAIYIYAGGTVNAINATFFNNQTNSSFSGGAIVSYGTLNISDSTFSQNKGGSGGAVYPRHSAVTTIRHSTFSQNETTNTTNGWGGAILSWDGPTVTIEDSTFGNNRANSGGAIFNTANSTLNIVRSTFVTNFAMGNQTPGGAIVNYGTTNLTSDTLMGNGAPYGGALANYNGTLNATNVTLFGNYSSSMGNALYNNQGNANLTNVTIFTDGNGTSYGQIVHYSTNNAKRVRLKNTIIDASDSTPNFQAACYNDFGTTAPIISDGFNLFTDGGCGNLQLSDKINTPSLLGTLANNGGATATMLPQANSLALNNGTASGAPTTDQRGIARPQNTAVDIGAVERCVKSPKPTLIAPTNGSKVGKKPKLDWSDDTCFGTYNLLVRRDSKTGTIFKSVNNLTASEYPLKGLTSGVTYYWRVTLKNEGGNLKSGWGMFTVK